MAVSQNGWVANERDRVASQLVPGTAVKLTVRKDAPGLLLLEVAAAFDRLVQDIDNARGALDDWGYAERPIRGSSATSNHASGTAIDLNATRWALGKPASVNLSNAQIGTVRKIVAATGGVVRWGGDYTGRLDPMHFEINDGQDMADCERALAAMRKFNGGQTPVQQAPGKPAPQTPPAAKFPTIQLGSRGPAVATFQRFRGLKDDGIFGPATQESAKGYQRMKGLTPDGIVGPATWRATGL